MVHRNKSNGRRAASARGFMALFAMLAMAAIGGGSASAAPAETVLHSFSLGAGDGAYPVASLYRDSSGNLYGTTSFGGGPAPQCSFVSPVVPPGCGVVFELSPDGTSYSVLYTFAGGASDGINPTGGLIADSSGNLYGTTYEGGGGSGCGVAGCGVVFELSPPATPGGKWTETLLYSFAGGASDGANPTGGLIADSSGNLYGTTETGGGTECGISAGCGTVFELSPPATPGGKWTEKLLHNFAGGLFDGYEPHSGLIFDSSGNLYGTTYSGGGAGNCFGGLGCGVVFALSPPATPGGKWTKTLLHSFEAPRGANPQAGLYLDSSGNLYGTTKWGGGSGQGVVFKLLKSRLFIVLHSFAGPPDDGADPEAALLADSSGNLYGTTFSGGGPGSGCHGWGCGTVFTLSPSESSYSVVYTFAGPPSDGASPQAGLIADSAGNLYGTTELGGAGNVGMVFKLTPQSCTCQQCCANDLGGCVNGCPDAGDCPGEPPQAERNCLQEVRQCFRSCVAASKRCIASCK